MKIAGYLILATLCGLTLLLAHAKLTGLTPDINWWGVLSPLLTPAALFIVGGAVAAIFTPDKKEPKP